ncbi:MAG: hypothetical protein AMXMBFR84_28480 [Candidatus Hydrogenedentota bacterium]
MSWRIGVGLCLLAVSRVGIAQSTGESIPYHRTPWTPDGAPLLGTYTGMKYSEVEFKRIREVGMNVTVGPDKAVEPGTPEAAASHESGIKVLYHLTKYLYHGVKLREPISPDQNMLPLNFGRKVPEFNSNIVQIDDELIRYTKMDGSALVECERGYGGTTPADHREGTILFWPELCAADVARVKDSPNLFGYYVLDDSPGDAVSALRALYKTIRSVDPDLSRPVCAGYGDAGSLVNFAPGVCDIMFIYWYPVSTQAYHRESTSAEVQRMITAARQRVPGVPFAGVYQAFDGRPANTGQGVPSGEQLREQLEDFVREGACGFVAYTSWASSLPGWMELPDLENEIMRANTEMRSNGGLIVRAETPEMAADRIQPQGVWAKPQPVPGVVPAWQVLGPFQADPRHLLDTPCPPDSEINFEATYPLKTGMGKWRTRETTCGVLGLGNLYGDRKTVEGAIDYAYCEVISTVDQTVVMHVSSDDDAWIRFNGEEVYRHEGNRGLSYVMDTVEIRVPAGASPLLAKVHNRKGMWGLSVEFRDTRGNRIEHLTFK